MSITGFVGMQDGAWRPMGWPRPSLGHGIGTADFQNGTAKTENGTAKTENGTVAEP